MPGGVRLEWSDRSTHAPALEGIDAVYLVPPAADPDPGRRILDLVALGARRGVRRVVLLGAQSISSSDPGLGEAQRHLPDLVPEWAVLRPSWFMQNLLGDHHLAHGLRQASVLRTATGSGRLPFIDADDIAAAAAAALLGPSPDREVVLTGPESLSYGDVAQVLSEETGRTIRHESVDPRDLVRVMAPTLGTPFAEVLAAMDARTRDGAWEEPTDEVLRLTGRRPTSLRSFVRRHRGELAEAIR
jgi:uncharacterized protein YbjT (DUF2867 family)